jgi:signal transduction histidine kinase
MKPRKGPSHGRRKSAEPAARKEVAIHHPVGHRAGGRVVQAGPGQDPIMNPKPVPLLRGYLAALRRHVKAATPPEPGAARTLGTLAVKKGLEILDLAKIHEDSLIALGFPLSAGTPNDEMIRRAGTFFAGALTPIEEFHRGTAEANIILKAAVETLKQRTSELDSSNRELIREVTHRKEIEDSLRTRESTTSQLLLKSRLMQDEFRLLSRRLLSIQEEERMRISRELHDVIAQTLVGINVRLATLRPQSTADTKNFQKKIETTQELLEKSMGIVHRFAIDLRPTVLDDLGLVPALRSHLKRFKETTGITVTLAADPAPMNLTSAYRTVLYRIAQEALANVSRHSKATHAKLVIDKGSDHIRMEITDNGVGFKIADLELPDRTERLGLLGMRERMVMAGGTFRVESVPGSGTTIRVELPPCKRRMKRARAGNRESPPSKLP